jgi:CHAT domain-containing protein/tetratricopeptide (TPR) repeat protein
MEPLVRAHFVELHKMFARLHAERKYSEAQSVARQALALAKAHLGEWHNDTGKSHTILGIVLHEVRSLSEARHSFEAAHAICAKSLGPEHPDTAITLFNLGSLLIDMEDLAGAQRCLTKALAIYAQALGPDHRETARCLNLLGRVHHDAGDLNGALPYYKQALAVRRALDPHHNDTAESLHKLGSLLHRLGDMAGARPYLEEAIAISRESLGNDDPNTAKCLTSLGYLLRDMRDSIEALSYFEEASRIMLEAMGPDHPDSVTSLDHLGLALLDEQKLDKAQQCFEQALAINQKVRPKHEATASCLNHLGLAFYYQRNLDEAKSRYEQALVICPRHSGALHNLALVLHAMGDLAGARPRYEEALKVHQKAPGQSNFEADKILSNLACLYVAMNQVANAFALMQRLAVLDDRLLGLVFSVASEKQQMVFLGSIQHHTHEFLSFVRQHLGSSAPAVRAAFELVLRRKGKGLEARAAQRDAVRGGKYPHLRLQLKELADLRLQLAREVLGGSGSEGLEKHLNLLAALETQKDQLEAKLARQIPEMNLERNLHLVDLQTLATSLPQDVGLVEFVQFRDSDFNARAKRISATEWELQRVLQPARYLAFVLPGRDPDNLQMFDLGEVEPIDQLIADFRSGITGEQKQSGVGTTVQLPKPDLELQENAGRQLRAAVFDKLVTAFGDRKRLLLVPDGNLARLPFEVLPAGDGRLLIDNYKISYVSCGRDVLRFGVKSTSQATDPVVIADPAFNLAAQATAAMPEAASATPLCELKDVRFRPLKGTRAEGEQIAKLLGAELWAGADALKVRLEGRHSPRVLHLATHGFSLPDQQRDLQGSPREGLSFAELMLENPLFLFRSFLALSGANIALRGGRTPPEAGNGLVSAAEISELDLSATELVVLSACGTGLGEVFTGEGIFGLRRAFVLAGARSLVISLWDVPDHQTRDLMVDFYRRMLPEKGRGALPVADALREAQLAMKQKYPDHPYYWGAFIYQGDQESLAGTRRSTSNAST